MCSKKGAMAMGGVRLPRRQLPDVAVSRASGQAEPAGVLECARRLALQDLGGRRGLARAEVLGHPFLEGAHGHGVRGDGAAGRLRELDGDGRAGGRDGRGGRDAIALDAFEILAALQGGRRRADDAAREERDHARYVGRAWDGCVAGADAARLGLAGADRLRRYAVAVLVDDREEEPYATREAHEPVLLLAGDDFNRWIRSSSGLRIGVHPSGSRKDCELRVDVDAWTYRAGVGDARVFADAGEVVRQAACLGHTRGTVVALPILG